jgi:hypothetical protein
MAQDAFARKPTPILGVESRKTEPRSTKLKRFAVSGVVAALIAAGGFGAWQQNLFVKTAKAEIARGSIKCSGQKVVVFSPVSADARIACEGARDAIEFLESYGLDIPGDIEIELLTRLPAAIGDSAAGCRITSRLRAMVLVYSEFRKFETWFGVPIDRSLYRSVVSHEVAHVVADANFTIPKPSIQAKEYIAYITQFSTMEPELRDRALALFPGQAFEGEWQMSTTLYMLDPMGFGIRAYLHFTTLIDGNEYLRSILNGEALVGLQDIYY